MDETSKLIVVITCIFLIWLLLTPLVYDGQENTNMNFDNAKLYEFDDWVVLKLANGKIYHEGHSLEEIKDELLSALGIEIVDLHDELLNRGDDNVHELIEQFEAGELGQ